MPTYKYKREDGTTFEVRQSIKDDALDECPDTGQKVKRVISGGGGVVYKGDGFYVTDYKNKDKPNNGSNNNASNSSSNGSGGESASEASTTTENSTSN
ncbi:MAG TPA: zinc ribbon domain-containing protein [Cryomorphaceae bacterium]|nr:zinc ribbon domain-containing protein [Cryomorphaceae bacterium]